MTLHIVPIIKKLQLISSSYNSLLNLLVIIATCIIYHHLPIPYGILIAAYAEDYSNHPISLSIKKAYDGTIDTSRISEVQEIAGHGVQAVIDGRKVLAGNAKLMKKENIKFSAAASVGTVVYLACDGIYLHCVTISKSIA